MDNIVLVIVGSLIMAVIVAKAYYVFDVYSNKKAGYHDWQDTNPIPSIVVGVFWPLSLSIMIIFAVICMIVLSIKFLFFKG